MADIAEYAEPVEAFEEQAAPATRVRGYWRSVLYRLRHDPVTLAFGAVVLLTKAMAVDHAAQNIRVNCICPGDVDTPMLRDEARQLGEAEDRFLKESAQRPMQRLGRPEEIAQAALYLASDASSFVTGTALVVDGGGLAGSV